MIGKIGDLPRHVSGSGQPAQGADEASGCVLDELLRFQSLVGVRNDRSSPRQHKSKNAIAGARALPDSISLIDLDQTALARALEPFPITVRTRDAIHLRLIEAAKALSFDTEAL